MRRSFQRTSGSPQAIATTETPAHYTPTLLLQFGSFVRGGDWKCRAYYVFCSEEQLQRYKNLFDYFIFYSKKLDVIAHLFLFVRKFAKSAVLYSFYLT